MRSLRRRQAETQPGRRMPIATSEARKEGDRCRDEQRWAEASVSYRRHLEEYPGDAAIWVQLGNSLKEAGSFVEARAAYWQAVARDGSDADMLLQLGHLQKLMGRPEEAAEAYRASLLRQPDGNPAASELARLQAARSVESAVAPPPLPAPPVPSADFDQRLEALEQRLQHFLGVEPDARIAASGEPAPATKVDGPTINVVVDALPDPFVRALLQGLVQQRSAVRLVRWNDEVKQFQLLARDGLKAGGLPSFLVSAAPALGATTVIAPSSSGPDDWLLVPGTMRDTEPSSLIEMDIILAARRLGTRSAFIFHGADQLRLEKHRGRDAVAHERYMQNLMLADVVLPVSTLAANDLRAFFAQHQCAAAGPLIRKILPPEDENAGLWDEYAKRLDGILSDMVDDACHVSALYLLVDLDRKSQHPAMHEFVRQTARALADRGTVVIPAQWDGEAGRLVHVAGHASWCFIGNIKIWGDWVDPGEATAPSWILEVDATAADATLLGEVSAFAKDRGLRMAAILGGVTRHEDEGTESLYRTLASLDKVLVISDRAHAAFQAFLLSWRGRLHSVEHRFKKVAPPGERLGCRRRSAPRIGRPGFVDILVLASGELDAGALSAFGAMADASDRFDGSLAFTIVGQPAGVPLVDFEAKAAELPGARWATGATDAEIGQLLETTDFAIGLGSGGEAGQKVADCLSLGIPCLVHVKAGPATKSEAGVVAADLGSTASASEAILKLCDEDWRRCVSRDALARPVRSYDDFAKDIGSELATDRLVETLHAIETVSKRDVYSVFANLEKRPKLSLCISTYNRAGWIQVNLQNIFSQIPEARSDLEVLVVDNTSTDHTPEVVKPFLSRRDFRYVRNPKNVGMLGNLAVTAQQAKGEYVWILGDDDLTRPGMIERMLQIIDDHPGIGLIYMNYGYTTEANPGNVTDLDAFLANFNVLELAGPDEFATVKQLAAKCENFFTAIYSHVYRRDHALRSYCQDTSGRIFSTMLSCVPTAYYVLNYMADEPAFWIGEQALVVNSNVSWQAYGVLLDLEQLPRTWDLAERMGTDPAEVDRRRANRLWLVEMMWREIFEADPVGNSAYFSASRVLTRLKHLSELDKHIPEFARIYRRAHLAGHPAAQMPAEELFSAFQGMLPQQEDAGQPPQ